ncbi:MAG: SH3 domain-containing protein [Actinomycetota bacterium]
MSMFCTRRHRRSPGTPNPLLLLAMFLTLVLVVAACSSGDDAAETTTSTTETGGPTTGDGSTTTDATSGPTTETTAGTTSSATATTTGGETTLPGEPFEGFVEAGNVLAVFGVAHDDQLNLRAAPGTDQAIVARAAPTADDLVATGRARTLPRSIWYEVTLDGVTGWSNARFLAYIAATDDATAEYLADVERPSAPTMSELGVVVADWFATEDPDSDIVESVAGSVGDLGEVTVDVVGIGDDAVAGYRLHIFAEPDPAGDRFDLRTIERTWLCWRGTAGELCV